VWARCGLTAVLSDIDLGVERHHVAPHVDRRLASARHVSCINHRSLTVSDEQTIYYDDVVVATERIGCRK